jgi:hypothetical protein
MLHRHGSDWTLWNAADHVRRSGQLYGNVPLFKPRLLLLLLLLSTCTFFSSLHTQKLLQPQLRAMNVRSSEIIIGISCASLGTR